MEAEEVSMKLSIGFTGTRRGLTREQHLVLIQIIDALEFAEFHHGDCIGADAEAHAIVRSFRPRARIVVHPGALQKLRAGCRGDETRLPAPFLARNKRIVSTTDVLIAAPGTQREILRSGTWATVRVARRMGRPVILVFPKEEK
jgi:hypothetical protein